MAIGNIATSVIKAAKRLQFLREKLLLIVVWPVAAFILGMVGWHFLFAYLDEELREAEDGALTQATASAKSYAAELNRAIGAIDQLTLHARYGWKLAGTAFKLEEVEDEKIFPPASVLTVSISDRNGVILTSTFRQAIGATVDDRLYFEVQRTATGDTLYVGQPIASHIADRTIIPFSRRLSNSDGGFEGVVFVAVAPDYFTETYDESILGKNGLLGILGNDGVVRSTRIGKTVQSPQAPAFISLPKFRSGSGSTLINGERFGDKRSRYIGWDTVSSYPLIALTGLDWQEALAPYFVTRATLLRAAAWDTVALLAFTLIAMALSMRLAWRKYQNKQTQAAYRTATEAGKEGFYIVRPIADKKGNVTDFEIIDSNLRGAEFLRYRRNELLGKRISTLYEAANPDNLIAALCHAVKTGSYQNDVEVPGESPVVPRWVHLTVARADNDLAVTVRDISEAKAHVSELERRSNEDMLTGLPNRHWVLNYLPQAVQHAAERHAMLAVLFIDLDGFKAVNDSAGHAMGDELLRNAASRLMEAVRPHDYVIRLGGDEFLVILEKITHKSDAAHVAERIQQAFAASFRLTQGMYTIGASIGVSIFPSDGTDAETLMRNADVAMYSVKAAGKGSYQFFDQKYYDALRIRLEQEADLRYAVDHDQFLLYYQPRIDMGTGNMTSMEALVRWAHPTKGLIAPFDFIPLAEETGLILRIGELVIDKACAQLARWSRQGQLLVPVSVNVSSQQFNEVEIAKILSTALDMHNIDPGLVEIELTESLMMHDDAEVAGILTKIRNMGIRLLVDDFGTGYSSLSQLQRLDFDVLKVDQAFTAEINRTERGKVFFNAIITMAHALGMRVVAEGVESAEQIKILRSLNCDEIQGYYVSKPLPASERQPILRQLNLP